MFDNKARKEERLRADEGTIISTAQYNATIGGLTLYGLLMNAALASTATAFMQSVNPLVFLLIYFVCSIAGVMMSVKSTSPMVSFIGYNLVVVPIGLLLSLVIPFEDPSVVTAAILTTAAVTAIMVMLALMKPDIFDGMGRALSIALIVGFIAELIAKLLGYGGDLFNWLFVLIFAGYIGYDLHVAQRYPKTLDNAIDSALDMYLDIINLFMRLLQILGNSKRR